KLFTLWFMSNVAIDTRDVARLMRTSVPEHAIAFGVAGKAGVILFLNRVLGVFREADRDCIFAAASSHMGFAGPVARLAAKFLLVCAWVGKSVAHHCVLKVCSLIGMACDTHIRADVVTSCGGGLRFRPCRLLNRGTSPNHKRKGNKKHNNCERGQRPG